MKEKIIEFNKSFGLNTKFIIDSEIEGYSLGNTIYLNENSSDIEKINKHELLHFFEIDETFKKMKENILKLIEDKIERIRRDYYLRYYGLYSEEEIQNGVIDTEIVIDILVDNFIIEYDDGLKLGDYVLKEISKNLEHKRYLNISINNQINNMNMSKWEKLFVLNYYDGKENRIFPQKEARQERIKEDIRKELVRLYNLEKEDFIISPNSKDIIREFESEMKALEARGESNSHLKENKAYFLNELAESISEQLYEEYKHIVDFIKGTNYEDSFKVLMLRETLSKTYKLDTVNGKKTIVNKRNMHETIASHMTLNETVLNIIYNNVNDYNNFANLYFAGLEIFNQTIAKKNNITLDNVETYGMGHWIKFDGKTADEENYLKNAQELSSLVKNTPWCTKSLASSQLSEGDFYVFVDNSNNPHIAVKMNGDEIEEVRGTLNGNAQELEEDYRKVAISFLENNKEIKNGKEWLRKEEWNKRLVYYIKSIENGTLKQEDIPKLMEDYFGNFEYRSYGGENSNKSKLRSLLPKITKNLAEYYGCNEDEIILEDISFSDPKYKEIKICPYKIIIGNADFRNSEVQSLGSLTTIGGRVIFMDSQVQSLGNLKSIGEDAVFLHSIVKDLGDLTNIDGNAYFEDSQIQSLGNLTTIGGNAYFGKSQVQSLGNLKSIGGDADFKNSKVQSLGNLKSIGGEVDFRNSEVQSLGSLTTIGGRAIFVDSKIKDLRDLINIGGNAYFEDSQIQSLDNLTTIGGNAFFVESQVQSLGNLTTIGGNAYFGESQVQSLGNLKSIGGDADFRYSIVKDLGDLTNIGGNADFRNSQIEDLKNLMTIGGEANFRDLQFQSLGGLTSIGGDVIFSNSQIKDLGDLTSIGGSAYFEDSKIQSLNNLKTIKGNASFRHSQVQSLGNLISIGGNVYFIDSKIQDFDNLEKIGGKVSGDSKLIELYYLEFDETGHRIKKGKLI